VKHLSFIAAIVLVSGAACGNDCYTLAKSVCQCATNANAIAICNSQVAVENGLVHPTTADLKRCHDLLQVCDCRTLTSQSLQSKVSCGLARENPTDRALNP
jgi:hypothetical protein